MGDPFSRHEGGGYTILELMVVISIIALLGGLSIAAFQVTRRNYQLSSSASEIATCLRRMRNRAITKGIPLIATVDPTTRTISGRRIESLVEWSFEDARDDPEKHGTSSKRSYRTVGARIVPGRVGQGLAFDGPGAHVDCGERTAFEIRDGLSIEAWVRHERTRSVAPPIGERKKESRKRLRAKAKGRRDPSFTILAREGAYFLGMTASGALEAGIGDYLARTADGVVAPGRWTAVGLRFDAGRLSVQVDGVERDLKRHGPTGGPSSTTGSGTPGPPARIPTSSENLTISSAGQPFPGAIDEVRIRGIREVSCFSYPEYQRIIGWKKEIHFDHRGHLDPAYHESGVRIVLVELDDEEPSSSRTVVLTDYSLTFDEWVERHHGAISAVNERRKPGPELRGEEQEAKIEQRYARNPKAVVEVDLLGVVR